MHHTNASDSWMELMSVARTGSREAIGKLLDAFRRVLDHDIRRRLTRTLQSKESASDLVQQSFATAYKNFESFQGSTPEEFRAWLREILQHHLEHFCRAYRTTAKRNINREVALAWMDPRTGATLEQVLISKLPSPIEVAATEERYDHLKRAYVLLPPDAQQILRWHFWERASFKLIAARLQCSEEAARSRHRRALATLRDLITPRTSSVEP